VPRQEEALLALRKQHLSKLHQIYHQRQSLNMQVGSPHRPSLPPRSPCFLAYTFLPGHRAAERLSWVLAPLCCDRHCGGGLRCAGLVLAPGHRMRLPAKRPGRRNEARVPCRDGLSCCGSHRQWA
jgi:hypothetical protein